MELLVDFSNEINIGEDGWGQIAPLGDFRGMAMIWENGVLKKFPAWQRIDKQAVTQMANEFKQSRKGIRGFLKGRGIFNGHADVPGMESRYPDKLQKGVFIDLEAREDGLYGLPVFTNEGEQLLTTKKARYFSGRWDTVATDETKDGLKVFRPSLFISAALTNKPNLPVQMLNEAEEPKENPMLKKVITFLALHGVQIANEATEEQAATALETFGGKLKSDSTQFANEKTRLESDVTARDTEIGSLKTERDNFKTSFANERKARVEREIGLALETGRITAAEKPDWERRLGNETQFANELSALEKLAPKVKTQSFTMTRGDRKVELANESERREMVAQLINEVCSELNLDPKKDYNRAFNEVQKRHPALFTAMQQPETKAKRNGARN